METNNVVVHLVQQNKRIRIIVGLLCLFVFGITLARIIEFIIRLSNLTSDTDEYLIQSIVILIIVMVVSLLLGINELRCRKNYGYIDDLGMHYRYQLQKERVVKWESIHSISIHERPYCDGKVFAFKPSMLISWVYDGSKSSNGQKPISLKYLCIDYNEEIRKVVESYYKDEVVNCCIHSTNTVNNVSNLR